ncbi:thioredoxin-dependent thiol peroxidase [Methylomonas methanica]|uniref:thioredoxin-dependent peroxiredoxin n=1 Tax=Methylomonas methanica (strain DSM 25384 / MC09) TaxID=857087 RepID=G0A646_METMM|nr:thioredoxin-dependent thiol peroxidase [Methylomonas methanica]AEG00496.1 alkyl hydroperoxide reductase/ Thiol specific antioxidant/ Mal allergen [Methylomonas methanica MC09]
MTTATLGQTVPDFQLPATGDKTLSLADFAGKKLLLYFYPKDNTPGCTQEGQAFRDHIQQFEALNTVILGVSRDSVKMHEGFKCKQGFPFDLLSDQEEQLCQMFDVIKMKNMYGKQVRGIERSTFLIDEAGVLIHEWRKVKVKTHVEEVLQYLQQL